MTTTDTPEDPDPDDPFAGIDAAQRREIERRVRAEFVGELADSFEVKLVTGLGRALQVIGQALIVVVVLAMFIAVAAAVLFGMWKVGSATLPGEIEPKPDAGFLDLIFGNRYVVWAARVVLLATALSLLVFSFYLVASIIARTIRRQWLRSAGPFHAEVVDAVQSDIEDAEAAISDLEHLELTNLELSAQLEQTTDELQAILGDLGAAHAEIDRLERLVPEDEREED